MKKKHTTGEILEELGFNEKEKEIFMKCIKTAKEFQKNETIDVELTFDKLIQEAFSNVI